VRVGDEVMLEVDAESPPGAGGIIEIEWDMLGRGDWSIRSEGVDGSLTRLSSSIKYRFDSPGTYFPAVRVSSHRESDINARSRRIPNIARVRVVVTE
jgi:hypothetical protein